ALVVLTEDELPDGLTVDEANGIWGPINGSGQGRGYIPRGTLLEVIGVIAGQVPACQLGGPNAQRCVTPTWRDIVAGAAGALAGSLLVADTQLSGMPVREFAG